MTQLDGWLKQATRSLAKDSAEQVRAEIQQHYESARASAMNEGATSNEADKAAVETLGDARLVNRQYRRVLLTSAEAKILRDGNREARAICGRPVLKRLLPAVPVVAVAAALALYYTHHAAVARDVLISGIGMSPLFLAPLLPVYTPFRSRVYRTVKWVAIFGTLLLVYGPETLKWSWLLIACLWPLASTEWTRASIRRKLPTKSWPKHLYL